MTNLLRTGLLPAFLFSCLGLAACSSSDISPKSVCKHLVGIVPEGKSKDMATCVEKLESMKAKVGAEGYERFAKCAKGAESAGDLMGCAAKAESGASSPDAYDRYIKKSKSSEAVVMLKRLHDGVRSYAMEEHVDPNSMTVSGPALPEASTGIVPPLGSCCAAGGRCEPNAALWDHPSFLATYFAVVDPHYYSYEYEKLSETEFAVRAHGDLDCDGTYSTFTLTGTMSPDGEIQSSGDMVRENELE